MAMGLPSLGGSVGSQVRATSVASSPDGSTVAVVHYHNVVRLERVDTRTLVHVLEGHKDRVLSVAFSPDGKILASGSYDQTVRGLEGRHRHLPWHLRGT